MLFSHSVMSYSLQPHGLQHPRFPCPSPSPSLLRFLSIALVMPSNYFILCHFLLLPSIFPSMRAFPGNLALLIRWPKYQSPSFSISPSKDYPGLISPRINWLALLVVQRTPRSSSSTTIQKHQIRHSALSTIQLSHLHVTTRKTIPLTLLNF